MRSRSRGLVILLVFLAACGSKEPSTPPEAGVNENRETGAEPADPRKEPSNSPAAGVDKSREIVAGPADPVPEERAALVGKFITTEGEHAITTDGRFAIHVVREGHLLKYSLKVTTLTEAPGASSARAASMDKHTSTMGTEADIDPNSDWFIHVESPVRYWAFDGNDSVTLIEYTVSSPRRSEMALTDLESSPERLLKEMPKPVKERIPEEVLARRR